MMCSILPERSVTMILLWFESDKAILFLDIDIFPGKESVVLFCDILCSISRDSFARVPALECFSKSTSTVSSIDSF